MFKKISFLVILISLLNLNALELKKGWNLVSFPYKSISTLSLKDENIKAIWGYNEKWFAYSNDQNYSNILIKNNIALLKKLEPSKGYWIQAKKDFKINSTFSPIFENSISIKKGWNLIGAIEDKTSINEIDPKALYWKYKNGNWFLGVNAKYDWSNKFSLFNKDEGIWIYSHKNQIFNEDRRKKFLFLDENFIPRQVVFDGKKSSIDGFIHTAYKKNRFEFNQTGFLPISTYFKDNQLISPNIASSDENYIIFLEKNNQTIFENNNSKPLIVKDFTLDDYFQFFYPIKSISVKATPIDAGFVSKDAAMIVSNQNLKQSLTLIFDSIKKPDNTPPGKFIKGIKITARDVYGNVVNHKKIDGQIDFKPIFMVTNSIKNPFIYVLNANKWDLVGPGVYKEGRVYSKNWSDKFTKYILMDDENLSFKKSLIVKNSNGQVLRDVIIVSNDKIAVSTNYDGNFTYLAPTPPKKLIAYKKGYKPKIIDINQTKNIVLEPLEDILKIQGVKVGFDKNFSLIYTIGTKDKKFIYDGNYIKNHKTILKPTLLADIKYPIYSIIKPYEDGYILATSDSKIIKLDKDGKTHILDQGKGLIYDGFNVKDSVIYFGTFGDNFTKIENGTIARDDSLSEAAFLDTGLSVVYKPLITDSKIYIPLYNQSQSTKASILIKDKDLNNINLISNLGTPGKLSKIESNIVFGTSSSKIVFIDISSDSVSKTFDFNGSGIIANIAKLNGFYFAIDLNGTLKKFNSNGALIDKINLTPSSVLFKKDNDLAAAGLDGKIYILDSNLSIKDFYKLESGVLAEPVNYKNDIYFLTKKGSFYKNETKIGTFSSKITNINLFENSLIFGCENGAVWRVDLD